MMPTAAPMLSQRAAATALMVAAGLTVAILAGWIASLHLLAAPEETHRMSSPAGALDAVVTFVPADNPAATLWAVYLVPAGMKPSSRPVARADHIENLSIAWVNGTELSIRADRARVLFRQEHWTRRIPETDVRIRFDIREEIATTR